VSFDNYDLVLEARKMGIKAFGFFDPSGGTGCKPQSWPKPPVVANDDHQLIVGYAGGLGPHNLNENLLNISHIVSESKTRFFIDMETNVRTNNIFDFNKVTQCLNIAKPFLSSNRNGVVSSGSSSSPSFNLNFFDSYRNDTSSSTSSSNPTTNTTILSLVS